MTVSNTKNKCFIVWNSKVAERFDAEYHNPIFQKFFLKLEKGKYKSVSLADISTAIFQGIGKNETDDPSYILLKVKNILPDNKIDYSNVEFIKDVPESKLLKKGDIISPFIGEAIRLCKFSVFNKEEGKYTVDNNTGVIRLDKNKVNCNYVVAVLDSDIGKKQLYRLIGGGGVPFLGTGNAKLIRIPLPPLSIQNQIAELMQTTYRQRTEKEQEAENLLNSIDDYVLDELGIKMPEIKDKKCFMIYSGEVINRRIDPKGHAEIPKAILKAVKKSNYQIKPLSDLIQKNIAGQWGKDPHKIKDKRNFILVKILRNTNFDNKTNLNFDKVAERLIEKSKFESIKLKKGDILIEKSGGSPIQPVGRVALIEEIKNNFAFSNFLQCFRINKEQCLPKYLFAFLKALYSLNYMEYIQNQTTGIKNLIMEEYLKIPVPLPDLNTQKAIATKRINKTKKAEQLKKEAENVVKYAKKEIEKIILSK